MLQKIASLKWHRRELQVSVVELECVAVKLTNFCSPDGAEESAGAGGEGRASSPAAQDCLQIQPLEQDLGTSAATAHQHIENSDL